MNDTPNTEGNKYEHLEKQIVELLGVTKCHNVLQVIELFEKTKKGSFQKLDEPFDNDELWKELIDMFDAADRKSYGYGTIISTLKQHFTITKK